MSKISTFFKLLKNDRSDLMASILSHCSFLFPDKAYLKLMFRLKMGYWMNWDNPKTFSEKLQWLKLYNRKPEYTTMVDKYAVKEYVAKIIGEEYIIPTIGVWNRPEEIDWDTLPNKFVLKTTHGGGGGGVVICRNKAILDKKKAIEKLQKSIKQDIYRNLREWPYRDVPKRIIAETFMEELRPVKTNGDLPDYKFFCFGGEPTYCQVITGRQSVMCIDFYNEKWEHQPFHEPKEFPFSDTKNDKPIRFAQMWRLASELSKGHSFIRVDFYEIDGKIYFGELTFFPTSGYGGFSPDEWDYKLGELIKLPCNMKN